jgi:2-oxo-hept-3-ene-1,7-dioate hydratase
MLSTTDREKAVEMLLQAERDHKPMTQLSTLWPDITFEDAYAIQGLVQGQKMASGRKLIGHKVGLTSKAMQRSSQISEPDYGHLLDDMMIADGAKVAHASFCIPRVEVELAFVLGKPLRYDTIADNGAAAGIVIGGRPVGPMEVDLRWVGGIMYVNGEIEETGLAAGVLGHPALGVAWLANKLSEHGVALEAGHLVLAGSFTRVIFARQGDTVHGDFGALGGVAVQFV